MRTLNQRSLASALASCALLVTSLSGEVASQCVSPVVGLSTWLTLDSDARDLLRNNHGSLVGTPSFIPGQVTGAVAFDGNDDGVTIPHDPSLNVPPTGFTIEFWMRGVHNQPQGLYLVVDKSHGFVDSTGWLFQGDSSSGALIFSIGAGGPGVFNFPSVDSSIDHLDGAYHHVAGTWDGTQIELFVDSVSRGTTPLPAPANNTRSVNLGFSWGGGPAGRFFRGEVDELSIYPRALGSGEIGAIFAAGSAGKCRPLASCAFRNGSGINQTGYNCTSNPVLGTNWGSNIATGPTTLFTLLAIGALPGQFPFSGGEILFNPGAPVVAVAGMGAYSLPIPVRFRFLGVVLPTQGLRVDAPAGVPTLVMLNAQDISLGF